MYIENLKNGDRDHDFVIDDALFYLQRAREAIEDGLKNPKEYRADCALAAQTIVKGFPYLWAIQQTMLPTQTDSSFP